jgi:hypothetical protein
MNEKKEKKEKERKEKKDTTESFPSYSLVVGKEHRPTFFSELFPPPSFHVISPLSLFPRYFPLSPSFNVIFPSLPLSVIFPPLFLVSMRSLCSRF